MYLYGCKRIINYLCLTVNTIIEVLFMSYSYNTIIEVLFISLNEAILFTCLHEFILA